MMEYKPVATGYYPSEEERAQGKRSKMGCEYGWSPTQWNQQEWSFFLSWTIQLAVIILSAVAMAKDGIPEVLSLVLLLETIIQTVEFGWYTIVGVLYLFGKLSIDPGYRYLDWFLSTPVMLTTLMFFGLWESNRCVRTEDLLGHDPSRVVALVVMIICDLLMLLVGASYANAKSDGSGFWASLSRFWDSVFFFTNRKGDGLFVGFVFLIGAFTPLLVMLGTDDFKVGGVLSIILSFVVWAVYGVVALARYWSNTLDSQATNTFYNLLDVVSKNIMGVVVAIVVLNGHYKDVQCSMVHGRPWEM
jgi:hypothetical protein